MTEEEAAANEADLQLSQNGRGLKVKENNFKGEQFF